MGILYHKQNRSQNSESIPAIMNEPKNQNLSKIKAILSTTFSWLGAILMPVILVFLTTIVILYSKGYRLTNIGTIIQTGALTVQSNVSDVRIYVNGHDQGVAPKILTGLEEGRYDVKVERDKYYSYSRDIPVNPGLSYTVYSSLFYTTENIQFQTVESDSNQIYFPTKGHELILMTKINDDDDLSMYKCTTGSTFWSQPECTEFWDGNSIKFKLDGLNFLPSPDNSKILISGNIETTANQNENIDTTLPVEKIIVFADGNKNTFTSADGLPNDLSLLQWSNDSKFLIYSKNSDLISYNFDKSITTILLGGWEFPRSYLLINGSVIYLTANSIERKDLDGTDHKVLISSDVTPDYQIDFNNVTSIKMDPTGRYLLLITNNYPIVIDLKDEISFSLTIDCPQTTSETTCEFISFSPDGQKAIFSKDGISYILWIEIEEWDYITTTNPYEIFNCSGIKCTYTWADDSSVIFVWKSNNIDQSIDPLGTIWYSDLWGENQNALISDIFPDTLCTDNAGKLFVNTLDTIGNAEELQYKLQSATIK